MKPCICLAASTNPISTVYSIKYTHDFLLLCIVAVCVIMLCAWWRHHEMETFSALLALCAGNSPVTGEFPSQRQVTRSFDVFFDLRLNKRLSKYSWGGWFATPSRSLWRHRKCGFVFYIYPYFSGFLPCNRVERMVITMTRYDLAHIGINPWADIVLVTQI